MKKLLLTALILGGVGDISAQNLGTITLSPSEKIEYENRARKYGPISIYDRSRFGQVSDIARMIETDYLISYKELSSVSISNRGITLRTKTLPTPPPPPSSNGLGMSEVVFQFASNALLPAENFIYVNEENWLEVKGFSPASQASMYRELRKHGLAFRNTWRGFEVGAARLMIHKDSKVAYPYIPMTKTTTLGGRSSVQGRVFLITSMSFDVRLSIPTIQGDLETDLQHLITGQKLPERISISGDFNRQGILGVVKLGE